MPASFGSAFSLLACIHRYILCHRSTLACIFAWGAASFDRPITRVACDSSIVGCIRMTTRSLTSLLRLSFQSARLYPSIHSMSSLDARLYIRLWCGIFRSTHHSRGLRQRYRRLHYSMSSLDARLYFRLWCGIFRSAHHSRGLRPRYRRLHSQ